NVICDHSLLSGYVKEQKIITAAIVKECAKELKIPSHIKNRDINGFADYHETKVPVAKPRLSQPQPEKIENREGKTGFKIFLSIIICLVFVIFAWFYLFPETYQNSATIIGKDIAGFKYKLFKIIPEPYSSFLKKGANQKEEQKKTAADADNKEKPVLKKIEDQKERKKTIENQAIKEPATLKKIQPIQDEALKEEEVRHVIQPQNMVKSSIDNIKKLIEDQPNSRKAGNSPPSLKDASSESSGTGTGIEIKNKILPLPRDKVVIRFKYNTNDFTEEGFKKLVKFADILTAHTEVKILISGYTDSEGYRKYNRKLSEFRANIVRSFFLGRGIKLDQIRIKGLGSQDPIESNDTAWGRMMNRRVEIEILEH
ncbi:MAG: OmpA family protein, partial [Deltaproteobacteria bacterium]|nr:OmpA family protein [Deltaproteobacteria bacterium]